jgi:hypothetical protein
MSNRRKIKSELPELGPGQSWMTMIAVVSDRDNREDIDVAMRETHDRLVSGLGELRKSGIHYTSHYAAEGRRVYDLLVEDVPAHQQDPETLRRLADPRALLIVAWCVAEVPIGTAIDNDGRVIP